MPSPTMPSLRLASISLVMLTAACGAGARYQAIGAGRTVVVGAPEAAGPGAGATAGMTAAVALPSDHTDSTYKVDFSVWLPRAMEVDYTVRCGAATSIGSIGETFEAYRERRLVELRRMQADRQRTAAAVGSLVGGAVVGQQQATAAVATPTAEGQATVAVDGQAAGAAVGASLVSTDVALANGDLGQGYRTGSARLMVAEANPGTCAVELAPRETVDAAGLAYLTGTFEVARLDDSAHWQAVNARKQSLALRAELRATLVARGGDVDWRRKQAVASLEAREVGVAEELRVSTATRHAELQVSRSIEARASSARQSIAGYLAGRGADPGRRARIAAELEVRRSAAYAARQRSISIRVAEQERRERAEYLAQQARWQFAIDIRLRLRGQLIGHGADPALSARLEADARAERARRAAMADAQAAADLAAWQRGQDERDRRAQMAFGIRASLSAQLTSRGARVRSPMPMPVDEMPGEPPLPGYTWVSGEWQWLGGDWRWMQGSWLGSGNGPGIAIDTRVQTTTATVVVPPPPPSGPTSAGVTVGASVGGVTVTVGGGATVVVPPVVIVPAPRPAPRPRTQDHR